jgi:hypothetical protein
VTADERPRAKIKPQRRDRHFGLADSGHPWPAWQARLAELAGKFRAASHDEAAYRLSDYAVAIELAGELANQALVLPWAQAGEITKPLWASIVGEASGAAGDERALQDVMSWAYAHQESFIGRAYIERDGTPRPPAYGWSGKWEKGENWAEIGFHPMALKRILGECGYDPEAMIELWKENNWFVRNEKSKNLTKGTHIQGEYVRLYTFARKTINTLDVLGEDA